MALGFRVSSPPCSWNAAEVRQILHFFGSFLGICDSTSLSPAHNCGLYYTLLQFFASSFVFCSLCRFTRVFAHFAASFAFGRAFGILWFRSVRVLGVSASCFPQSYFSRSLLLQAFWCFMSWDAWLVRCFTASKHPMLFLFISMVEGSRGEGDLGWVP